MRRLAVAVFLAVAASSLQAQSLTSKVSDLFRFGSCPDPLCLTVNGSSHGRHFIASAVAANGELLQFFGNAVTASLASIPLSATSSGATFQFEGAVPVQTSVSGGPIFAERAQTMGHGRLLVGANSTRLAFSTLRGMPLKDLQFNFTHQDVGAKGLGDPVLENDVISVRPNIDLTLQVTSLFVSYGLRDNIDIGFAVPYVSASLDGNSLGKVISSDPQTLHAFGSESDPSSTARVAASGTASGIGDVAARLKVNLKSSGQVGVAVLSDLRLPTGDTENFAGSGKFGARFLGVLSSQYGNFAPHLNAGYAYRSGKQQNSAVLGTLGFDHLVAPWATAAFDLISEWQAGTSKLILPPPVQFVAPVARQVMPTNIPDRRDNLLNASAGAKFLVQRLTIVGNVLVPIRDAGVQPNVTWTLGLERQF